MVIIDKDTCVEKCVGNMLKDIHTMIKCYNDLESIFYYFNECLADVLDELCNYNIDDPIPDDIKDKYYNIIKDLRNKVNKASSKRLDGCNHCISDKNLLLSFCFKCDEVDFRIPAFLSMQYLQQTDDEQNLLFFSKDPNIVPYNENPKVIFDNIPGSVDIYPVWYFMYQNKIITNYSYINDMTENNLTYDDLLKYRLLLSDKVKTNDKMGVEASGKYKFKYCAKEYEVKLPDPSHPSTKIDPKEQGVVNGLFSFADTIDNYLTVSEGKIAIKNSEEVIARLGNAVGNMSTDLCNLIHTLCKTSDAPQNCCKKINKHC